MTALGLRPLTRYSSAAPVVLRLVVGLVMAAHGWDKLAGGPEGFAGFLDSLGVPVPLLFAWLVTVAELGGGLMLIVGLLTRLAAIPIVGVLLGAIALVKWEVGLIAEEGVGAELDLALLAGAVAVILLGPGKPSVDHLLGVEGGVPADTAEDAREPVGAGVS